MPTTTSNWHLLATIEAMRCGAALLDVSVNGMGRGAGNCGSEQLLGYIGSSENIMSAGDRVY